MTIREAQLYGRSELTSSPSPNLDVDCLLQSILGCDKTFLLFHRDNQLTQEQQDILTCQLEQRKTGLPIAYITGYKEFYGRDFKVTPDVLIPKPDTEILVEQAIEAFKIKAQNNPNSILTICDMCTGSGCVGISIAAEIAEQHLVSEDKLPSVLMADISQKALDMARLNAERLLSTKSLSKMRFIRTNLFEQVHGSFDLIVSNPPYIPLDDTLELLKDGRNEPILALNGDVNIEGDPTYRNDGLGIIRNLVPQAYSLLSPSGILIVESGEYNAEQTQDIFNNSGFTQTRIIKDLEGQLRDTYGVKE